MNGLKKYLLSIFSHEGYVLFLCTLLFVVSLFLPAFYTRYCHDGLFANAAHTFNGLEALLFGWLAIGHSIAWFANIGLLITALLYIIDDFKATYLWAIGTLLIALSSVFFKTVERMDSAWTQCRSEWGAGYYFWMGSFIVLFIGVYIQKKKMQR